ncbi:hypothetical protein SCHPADRAFT_236981 [Schizopora paradoxa]|uniref:Uncharacterized protein n=1 Tax=Schizopora paradoxa TaxID=27342 RepID=A0A0H2RVD0_9AGAM|nr:hypothetical protein SCHPADRAFT_236981 [Schizopora paradoxa]
MQFPQAGETALDLWLERSLFAGVVLIAVFYGLHIAIFLNSMYYVMQAPATGKISWPFLSLLVCFFVVGTLQVAAQARFGELIWIDDRGFTGGPVQWYYKHYSDPSNILGLAALIFGNFVADGVLLYRMFIIWNRSTLVMAFPLAAYLASTALSVLAVFQAAKPNSGKWSHASVLYELPFWVLTTSLNVIITIALAYRLMKMRLAVIGILGADHAKIYTSVTSCIVESGAIYAAIGVACIVAFLTKSNLLNIVEPVLAQVLCICPELIILRVARGRAWTRSMAETTSARQVYRDNRLIETSNKAADLNVSSPALAFEDSGSFEKYAKH